MSNFTSTRDLKDGVTRRLKGLRQHWWLSEVWAVIICILCTVALGIVFWHYDGCRQPQWPLGITISSLSAILSKVIEFHIGSLFLCSMLRQLKLLWFGRPRRLKDIKRFDDAASGPFGVVRLMRMQRARGLASFVGFVMILHYSIGFFIQQAVAIRLAKFDAGTSSIPRIVRFDKYSLGQAQQLGTVDPSIQTAIYNGLFNEDISTFNIPYNCPTGNCQWPLYASLAVGSICESLDSEIIINCVNDTGTSKCNYTLPNDGPCVDGLDTTLNSTSYLNGTFFSQFSQQLISFKVIASPGLQNASVSALACALYLRVNVYSSAVTRGRLNDLIISSYYNSTPLAHGQPDWLISAPNVTNETFSMSGMSVFAESNFLWQLFSGTESGGINRPAYSTNVMQMIATSFRSGTLSDRIANVATMASNAKRMSSYSQSLNGSTNQASPYAAFGTTLMVQDVVEIRWAWLTLPMGVSFITVLMLMPVIWMMRADRLERVESGSLPWIEKAPSDRSRGRLETRYRSRSVIETAENARYMTSNNNNNRRLTFVR